MDYREPTATHDVELDRPMIARLRQPRDARELARIVRYLLLDSGLDIGAGDVVQRTDGACLIEVALGLEADVLITLA